MNIQSPRRAAGLHAVGLALIGFFISTLPCAQAVGDSVVVVNEIHYHPADPALEFVELHNQLSLNVDMSGWRFDGGITFGFPEGTVIPARGYLVVAANPAALQAATGFAGALGPFTGTLSNDGETLRLWNNNAALRTRPAPVTGNEANEWSVDIQGDGAGGAFGQVTPTLMSGPAGASGFGNVWNALTVAGYSGTAGGVTLNPSLSGLKNSAGATTGVGFSITGSVTGFSNASGGALASDYLFLNAGFSAPSVTWQLTGVNPAKTYRLWFYGSALRSCRFKVDINGNGSLADEAAVTAPANGAVLVSGITPQAGGVIIGNADTAGGEVNWSGFQLFIPATGPPPPVDIGAFNDSLERRRLMDELPYADSGAWPVGPDGSGFTLAKIDAQGGGRAANWTTSAQVNGTPGARNFAPPSAGPTSALDTSGKNRHATNVTGVTRTTGSGGYEGEAFVFDGAGAVDVPVNITPAVAPNATIGAWVQVSAINAPPRHEIISSDNGGFDRAITVDSRTGTSGDAGVARYGAFGGSGTGPILGMNATAADGWVFVCAVFDAAAAQTRLYVNGNITNGGLTHDASQTFLRIGAHPTGIEFFRGKIDNAFVFDRALTAGEIAGIRAGGAAAIKAPALAANLQGFYEFEDASGGLLAAGPPVALNEISGANDAVFQLELYNHGTDPVALTGWQLVSGDTGASYTFPTTNLAPGAYLVVNETTLGYRPLDNDRLFLRTPSRMADAVKIAKTARARQTAGTGSWLRPSAATFGSPNTFALQTSVVINEILYHAFDEGPEQWVELKNRTGAPIDISGWKFTDGIGFMFPAGTTIGAGQFLVVANDASALLAKYPGRPVVGPFSGGLGDGDSLTLEDANGNPADEVAYEEGGRWPEVAAGGGASLELRDADADNAVPESWSPSNTAPLGSWQTITYDFVATDDVQGNDAFHEFLFGYLDSGDVLLDDVSVRENPAGTNIEFIQNGTFQSDTVGGAPLKWRLTGTHGVHGRSVVVTDPDNGANKCLKIVCTGHTDDKHNKAETTFFAGRTVVLGRTYRVSFRAKWLTGSNLVNTRLYFNYGQRTHTLSVGNQWGTPGLENSTAIANAGPTAGGVAHSPVVPAAGAATTVSALLADPDGVASASLFYRVGSGAWQIVAMTPGANGRHTASIPGQGAGSLVQFYISANDTLAANAKWPAAGDRGGAFYRVSDNAADTSGIRGNMRVLIRPEDEASLLLNVNRMGNHPWPGTVIHDERVVYYNCDVSLKGSASSRPSAAGLSLGFPPDQPFRGVHTNVSIENVGNMKEIVTKHILNRAGGGYWSDFNDVVKTIGPGMNQISLLAPTRTTGVFLKSLFPNESNGALYNHELLYQPNNTVDGNPESLKLNNPYNHTRGFLGFADRGTDKEQYRWAFQLRNRRKADDYAPIIRINRAFNFTGQAFINEIEQTVDIDQWMRTWALMGLYGNDDQYGRLYPHNWRLYQRPTDGRLIALPWDLDRSFNLGTSASLIPTTDVNGSFQLIQTLFTNVSWKRQFDSHMLDLVNTTYNSTYMASWITHLGTVTAQNFSSINSYVDARGNYALTTLPASVPFGITTNSGADFTTTANVTTLTGSGWSDVYTITRSGQPAPLQVTWTGSTTWSVTIPLTSGANAITLLAHDQHGTQTGTDSITVTSSTANTPASAANIVISELHYHPADPTTAEFNAGHTDADDFQFAELHNISPANVELAGCSFTQGFTFNFTASTALPPGEVLVLARNAAAFQMRYGFPPGGVFTGRLSHSDENVTLTSATNAVIKSFRYTDRDPWPVSADGPGYSLILRRAKTNPDSTTAINWSSSAAIGGSPGIVENDTYTSWLAGFPGIAAAGPLDDDDTDSIPNAIEYSGRTSPTQTTEGLGPKATVESLTIAGATANYFVFRFRRHIGATDLDFTPLHSTDLTAWSAVAFTHHGSVNNGDGTETVAYRSTAPATGKAFGALQITLAP